MDQSHEKYMDLVVKGARERMERGGRPLFALIVKNEKIVGQGPHPNSNTMDNSNVPTAHAEINAILDACSNLGTRNLSGATLYCSMEPCPMCFSTTVLEVNIKRVVLGARHARFGRKDLGGYSAEAFLKLIRHEDVQLVTGVREAECEKMLVEWMRSLTGEQVRLELLRSLAY